MVEALQRPPAISIGRGSDSQRQAKQNAVIEALRMGHSRVAACRIIGINHDTLYDWIKKYSDFSDRVVRAEGEAEHHYLARIHAASEDPKYWQAAAWFLERRRPEDYARKDEQTILLRLGAKLDQLNDEQLLALASGTAGEVIDTTAVVEALPVDSDA